MPNQKRYKKMTLWTKAYKFRIYPTKEQKLQLAKTFGCCRFVFNYFLTKSIHDYEETGKSNSVYDNQKELTQLKKQEEFAFLKEVDSQALNYSIANLGTAYSAFFDKRSRYPKFKKKSHSQSYNTQNTGRNFTIEGNKIALPKVGWVKIKKHREVEGQICYATISKTPSNCYYISLCCKNCPQIAYPLTNKEIGIDLGIHDFAIFDNGHRISNPKNLIAELQSLKRLQRKLSREQKGSSNFNKQRIRVAKKHAKIANRRKDFLHKLSTEIAKNHDLIAVEDLNVKEMMHDNKFAKYVADVSWSQFLTLLEYKSQWHGRKFVKVDKYFSSSQLCNCCGYKNSTVKDLNIRKWVCP